MDVPGANGVSLPGTPRPLIDAHKHRLVKQDRARGLTRRPLPVRFPRIRSVRPDEYPGDDDLSISDSYRAIATRSAQNDRCSMKE